MQFAAISLRAQLSAAPLKQNSEGLRQLVIPRLRAQLSAAPLKRLVGLLAPGCVSRLRAQLSAAPLKPHFSFSLFCVLFLSPRSIERGPVEAGWHGVCNSAGVWSPRSIERGPVEAIRIPFVLVLFVPVSALN